MSKAIAALTLLLLSAGSAFGATADFIFFNKLALLVGLNIVLGGLLTLYGAVVASYLWDKLRQGKAQPVRVRTGRQETFRRSTRSTRPGDPARSPKVISG